jgi:2-methylisocitrate lyase-like PEP mutase family enzyme
MSSRQREKAQRFLALHERPRAFVIPNPWDAGTACVLASLGFEALTTTSAGLAFALGRRDGAAAVTRDETLANAKLVVDATDLPVAADLENGFGDDLDAVSATIRAAADAGLVGGSIEDASGNPEKPIYDFDHAVRRIEAAVSAARSLPFPFVLVARSENFLHGREDLDDTIARLQAFEKAGADVLYAPGVTDAADLAAICAAVTKPVNVLASSSSSLSVAELEAIGIRRISLGSVLHRAAIGALVAAAEEVRDRGTFTFCDTAMSYNDANDVVSGPR